MAKGKKSSGKTYTSKGQGSNVSKETRKAVRRETSTLTREMNVLNAWLKGKNTKEYKGVKRPVPFTI